MKIDRRKIIEICRKKKKSEMWLVSELGISLPTYYRRMRLEWTKEQVFALCFVLKLKTARSFTR